MGVAGKSHKYWAGWIWKEVSIDNQVEALIGGVTVYADKQLVVARTLDPIGLRFSGEIDVTNCQAIANCLTVTFAGAGDIHLDVSGLIFCDISGIRALVEVAEHRKKGRLKLHGLPDLLQTVMKVTGWADLPALVVCNCQGEGA